MKERVLRRNAYLARIDFDVFDILLIDFITILGEHDASPIVEALKVRSGNGHINAPDHHVAFLFGIDHGFVHAFHCRFKINDLALAYAARWCLADTQNLDGAIRPALADYDTDFGGSNLKTNHQIIARHCVNPFSVAEWELPLGWLRTGARLGRRGRSLLRRMHWNCLHNPRFYSRLDGIINDGDWPRRESHRDVSLHKQV